MTDEQRTSYPTGLPETGSTMAQIPATGGETGNRLAGALMTRASAWLAASTVLHRVCVIELEIFRAVSEFRAWPGPRPTGCRRLHPMCGITTCTR